MFSTLSRYMNEFSVTSIAFVAQVPVPQSKVFREAPVFSKIAHISAHTVVIILRIADAPLSSKKFWRKLKNSGLLPRSAGNVAISYDNVGQMLVSKMFSLEESISCLPAFELKHQLT